MIRRLVAVALGLVMVLGFVGFVATGAIHRTLTSRELYEDQLHDHRVFDRLLDEVARDPAFEPQLHALLGGVDVPLEDVHAQLRNVVTPARLDALAGTSIDALTGYFRGEPLRLELDLTEIVAGVHDAMIAYTIAQIDAKPVCPSASLDAFTRELSLAVSKLVTQGTIPACVPTRSIPPANRAEVADALAQAGRLDLRDPVHAAALREVVAALEHDDVALAIKVSASAMMTQLIDQSVARLTDSPYLRRDGDRYVLAPPEATRRRLEAQLHVAQVAGQAAGWAQLAGLAVVLVGAALMFVVFRGAPRSAMRWIGGPVMIGGGVALIAWMAARGAIHTTVHQVITRAELPESLRTILTDVSSGLVNGVTPSFLTPSIFGIVIGAALVAGSMAFRK